MLFKNINIIYTVLFLIFSQSLFGQYGVIAQNSNNNFIEWSKITQQSLSSIGNGVSLWENHLEFAVDQWVKPSKKRIELLIELNYINKNTTTESRDYSLTSFGFGVKSNQYVFDLLGNLDRPTYSKDGGFFKKGFFLQWNAHAAYWQKGTNLLPEKVANTVFDFGVGLGIDIGISDLITISPLITYQYYPRLTWEQFGLVHFVGRSDDLISKSPASMFKIGIRIGFRPDFLKEQRALDL